jgi:Ca2+-binding EF-hand superfamily protein
MGRNYSNAENLFAEYDSGQEGMMIFEDFSKMNEASGIPTNRKDLHRIFEMIDRNKNGKIRLDELKNITSLSLNAESDESIPEELHEWQIEPEADLSG